MLVVAAMSVAHDMNMFATTHATGQSSDAWRAAVNVSGPVDSSAT
jgi:hypothetical protein